MESNELIQHMEQAPAEVIATAKVEFNKEALEKITSRRKDILVAGEEYQLKAVNIQPYTRKDGVKVMIVNFNGMTEYHTKEAKKYVEAGDFVKAGNQCVTYSARIGKDFIPEKGQIVNVVFEEGVTKEGEAALWVTSVYPLRKAVQGFVSLQALGL